MTVGCLVSGHSYLAEAGGERSHAANLNVKNLLNALKDVPNWQLLGIQLGMSPAQIHQISSPNPMMDLLDLWLNFDSEPSWEKVATALDEMDKKKIAREIRTAYCSSDHN